MSTAMWRIDTSKTNIQINLRSDDPDVVTSAEGRLEFQFRRSIPIPDDMVVNLSVSNAQIPFDTRAEKRVKLEQHIRFTMITQLGDFTAFNPLAPPCDPWATLAAPMEVEYTLILPPGDYTAQSFAWFMDTQQHTLVQDPTHPINVAVAAYIISGPPPPQVPVQPINYCLTWCDNTYPATIHPEALHRAELKQHILFGMISQIGDFVAQDPTAPPCSVAWAMLPAPTEQAQYDLIMPPGNWSAQSFAWWMDITQFNETNNLTHNVPIMIAAYVVSGGVAAAGIPAINFCMNFCDNTWWDGTIPHQRVATNSLTSVLGTVNEAIPSIHPGTGAWNILNAKVGGGINELIGKVAVGMYSVRACDAVGNVVPMTDETEVYMKTLLGIPLTNDLPSVAAGVNSWLGGLKVCPPTHPIPPLYQGPGDALNYPKVYISDSLGNPSCGWCNFPLYPYEDSSHIPTTSTGQYVCSNVLNTVGRVEDAIPSIDPLTGKWALLNNKAFGGIGGIYGRVAMGVKQVEGWDIVAAAPEAMTTETLLYLQTLLGVPQLFLPQLVFPLTWIGGVNVCPPAIPAPPLYQGPGDAVSFPKIFNSPISLGNPEGDTSSGRLHPSIPFPLYPFLPGTDAHNIYVRTNLICGSVDSNRQLHDNIICKIPCKPDCCRDGLVPDEASMPVSHIFYEGDTKYGVLLQQPFLQTITIELVDHNGVEWDLPDNHHFNVSLLLQFIRRENPDEADPTFIETQEIVSPQKVTLGKEGERKLKNQKEKAKKRRTLLNKLIKGLSDVSFF